MCNIGTRRIDRTCVLIVVVCDQPEAFASDLGDDQSCYVCVVIESEGLFSYIPRAVLVAV